MDTKFHYLITYMWRSLIALCGALTLGCSGMATGPGGSSGDASLPPPGGASHDVAAAAPAQQPTEMGFVVGGTPMFFIHVQRADGTVDLSTDDAQLVAAFSPEYADDSHCRTKQGDSSPQIFPGDAKPSVYSSQYLGSMPSNACGKIYLNCPLSDQNGKSYADVFATSTDQGSYFKSDTIRIDCTKTSPVPINLILKQDTMPIALPPDNNTANAPL